MMSSPPPFFSLFPEILLGGGAARAEGGYTQGEEMNGIEIHHVKDTKNKFKKCEKKRLSLLCPSKYFSTQIQRQ